MWNGSRTTIHRGIQKRYVRLCESTSAMFNQWRKTDEAQAKMVTGSACSLQADHGNQEEWSQADQAELPFLSPQRHRTDPRKGQEDCSLGHRIAVGPAQAGHIAAPGRPTCDP